MDDYFNIPVSYLGQVLEFKARVLIQGYLYRVEVIVEDAPIFFEPDEERNFRALVTNEQMEKRTANFNIEIIRAIATVLQSLPEA